MEVTDRIEEAARTYTGRPAFKEWRRPPPRRPEYGDDEMDRHSRPRRMGTPETEFGADEKGGKITRYCLSLGDCTPTCVIYDICESIEVGNPDIPPGMLHEAHEKVSRVYQD
jgi:hypothetical protein